MIWNRKEIWYKMPVIREQEKLQDSSNANFNEDLRFLHLKAGGMERFAKACRKILAKDGQLLERHCYSYPTAQHSTAIISNFPSGLPSTPGRTNESAQRGSFANAGQEVVNPLSKEESSHKPNLPSLD